VQPELSLCRDDDSVALLRTGSGKLSEDVRLRRFAEKALVQEKDLPAVTTHAPVASLAFPL
jgi:hypothetical protein